MGNLHLVNFVYKKEYSYTKQIYTTLYIIGLTIQYCYIYLFEYENWKRYRMDKELRLKFTRVLHNMEGSGYLRSMIAYNAAPTIEDHKPSSLVVFTSQGKNSMFLWKQYGPEICFDFGLDYFELKKRSECIIVLLYRKKWLEVHLDVQHNQLFLQKMGYSPEDTIEEKLQRLSKRFEMFCPHDVGIFLGIPVEDVEGFILHKGKNCMMCRYWKVYADPQRAETLFNAYDMARSSIAEYVVNQCCV